MASDAQLTSNEYNEQYSRKVPIQLGDLEQFVMAFGVVDDYIEWMRFFKGVDIPGNGPAVIKQLKEARTLALALYNAPPPSETFDDSDALMQIVVALRAIIGRDIKRRFSTTGLENAVREIEWVARRDRPNAQKAEVTHVHLWSGAGPDAYCIGCMTSRSKSEPE